MLKEVGLRDQARHSIVLSLSLSLSLPGCAASAHYDNCIHGTRAVPIMGRARAPRGNSSQPGKSATIHKRPSLCERGRSMLDTFRGTSYHRSRERRALAKRDIWFLFRIRSGIISNLERRRRLIKASSASVQVSFYNFSTCFFVVTQIADRSRFETRV